jgi:hypothetical protein
LLTFGTNQITATDLALNRFPMTGFIVWIPTLRIHDALRAPEIVRALNEETPPC